MSLRSMRMRGIEPPRGCPHTDLNRARLPVPPHPRGALELQCSSWPGGTYDSVPRRARKYHRRIVRCLLAILLPALLAIPGVGLAAVPDRAPTPRVEVIVGLAPPPAARSGWRHADPAGRSARAALTAVEREQVTVSRRILSRIPGAEIRWRYRIVLAGLAVALPAGELRRLEAVPGVVRVYPSVRYGPLSEPEEARPGGPARDPFPAAGDTGCHRRSGPVGARARARGTGDEDRDPRRRGRSAASVLRPRRAHHASGVPERRRRLHERQGDRRPGLRAARRRLAPRGQAVRPGALLPRHARRRDRGGRARDAGRSRRRRSAHVDLGSRPARLHRQLQGADGADGVRPRPQRQLSGARRRDRGSRRRRDGRAQPVARRARGRAEPRCGGDRARQRRSCGRDPGRLGRKRLRPARARQRRLAGILGARDHRRRRRRRPDHGGLLGERADAARPRAQAGRHRAGRRRALRPARRQFRNPVRNEHGGTPCSRRRSAAPGPASRLDGRAGEVGPRLDRTPRLGGRHEVDRSRGDPVGRGHDPARAGGRPARLRDAAVGRPRPARRPLPCLGLGVCRPRRRGRRRRSVDGHGRDAERAGRPRAGRAGRGRRAGDARDRRARRRERAGGRAHGVRRPHARRRAPPYPVLVPGHASTAAGGAPP